MADKNISFQVFVINGDDMGDCEQWFRTALRDLEGKIYLPIGPRIVEKTFLFFADKKDFDYTIYNGHVFLYEKDVLRIFPENKYFVESYKEMIEEMKPFDNVVH